MVVVVVVARPGQAKDKATSEGIGWNFAQQRSEQLEGELRARDNQSAMIGSERQSAEDEKFSS